MELANNFGLTGLVLLFASIPVFTAGAALEIKWLWATGAVLGGLAIASFLVGIWV